MIYYVLACDYDGTLAHHGRLDDQTAAALERVKRSGRKLMMVTGRELPDLRQVCDKLDLFDAIVAENGALLYLPSSREERLLCEPPNQHLVEALQQRGVEPLSVGRSIIATWEEHKETCLDTIQQLGLEDSVIFNKGAVMILPANVNKGFGLDAGLLELGYSRHNVVAIGDAENDHVFLSRSGCAVAVANALPSLKERADFVTKADHGAGVAEFIDQYLLNDLIDLMPKLAQRHHIVLGETKDHREIALPAHRQVFFVTGGSGSGKSMLTGVLIERLIDQERTVCVIDPEGDYAPLGELANVIVMGGGNDKPLPSPDELEQLLTAPTTNLVLNLHALTLAEKTNYVASVLSTIGQVRAKIGRPHWLIIDEAHHVFPAEGSMASDILPTINESLYEGLCLISFDVNLMHESARRLINIVATRTINELATAVSAILQAKGIADTSIAALNPDQLPPIDDDEAAIVWLDEQEIKASYFEVAKRRTTHRRHVRKYATGELPEDRSFYFRGAENKLNLRAANLSRFSELAEGIDDETWLYHLKRGDYSGWLRKMIKNSELANEVADIEKKRAQKLSAQESRRAILEAISRRYSA